MNIFKKYKVQNNIFSVITKIMPDYKSSRSLPNSLGSKSPIDMCLKTSSQFPSDKKGKIFFKLKRVLKRK